jgi:hypothetical protein
MGPERMWQVDSSRRYVLRQLNGRLEGNKLAFVSDEALVKGKPTKIRYTMVWKRKKVIVWIAEWSVRGGPWKNVSESNLVYSWKEFEH